MKKMKIIERRRLYILKKIDYILKKLENSVVK